MNPTFDQVFIDISSLSLQVGPAASKVEAEAEKHGLQPEKAHAAQGDTGADQREGHPGQRLQNGSALRSGMHYGNTAGNA